MSKSSTTSYEPSGPLPGPVCEPGEFPFAAIGLDHGHINGMCRALAQAGGDLRWVYDPDPAKVEDFRARFPQVQVASSEDAILQDDAVQLIASAAIPSDRAGLGLRVMDHGKHYFADKPPLTTLEQLAQARAKVAETGKKYAVSYSERIQVESAVLAGQLIQAGAIGRVLQVMGTGPHRMSPLTRPAWFFDPQAVGGILCDIGSHQIEQILYYTGSDEAEVVSSRVANYAHKEYPGFDDFGDMSISMGNGATGYCRVDWFTPDGLSSWGDGRTFILGTEGYIELRKYVEVGRGPGRNHLYLVDSVGEHLIEAQGKVGTPYFGELIRDCLDGTEVAMTQEHAFKAAELCLQAQANAVRMED